MELAIIGPIKVKDGIFIGDEFAAHVVLFTLKYSIFFIRILNLWLQTK